MKRRPPRHAQPPALRWESEIWRWRCRLAVPSGLSGLMIVDRAAWLALAERQGWHLDTAFHLLLVIEDETAKASDDASPA